jgi:RNase P/RNase MRP subunit p29
MSGKISKFNLIQHELIGLQASIIDTPNKSLENISGKITNETMNTFELEYFTQNQLKTITVPKHKTVFRFIIPVQFTDSPVGISEIPVDINGSILTKRPEDRIKKLAKIVRKAKKNNNLGIGPGEA